ncbi:MULTISPECIES: R3H domain-containing nucleic acid-binding protein [Leptolyngbya]|uniref:R3H domain-containing nucleic acid-binding protein n=3 Tax=Leptolyngbya group TaxID=3081713 RepID=UPI002DD65828|nr:R3H domain-containing nucleic acid-binding protein [Leptolyngbya sp. GGD]
MVEQSFVPFESNASQSSDPVTMTASEHNRMQTTDDLTKLLDILPTHLRDRLIEHPELDRLVEVVMDLGRFPEARFPGKAEYLSDTPITKEDLAESTQKVGDFGGDNRAGIEKTLHRISAIRNRRGEVIGLTCRVGRAIFGTIGMIRDLVESGRSILMLGRPGVGKTTALREIARVLADELDKRVVIIDTSNEIAGDGDVPHPAIGRARRMQVARPELQHQVMIEAVENHMPEVIVIDEIGTELEALAARTIAERGVQLVGTAHGNKLENLIKNPTLSDLVGGIQSVTLGDEEARRRGSQKSVLERKAPPTFDIAVEMAERQKWVVHEEVSDTIDLLLRGRQPSPQTRATDDEGNITITHEAPQPEPGKTRLKALPDSGGYSDSMQARGWRSTGRMKAVASSTNVRTLTPEQQSFERMLDESLGRTFDSMESESFPGPNGEELPLHVYPYGVSRQQLDQVIRTLNLPIHLTKDMEGADAVLALRSHVKNHAKLRHLAKTRQIPIHTVKSNNVPQIAIALRRLLNMEEPGLPSEAELSLIVRGDNEDEMEALEEARLAVEQIVIPKGQPVELLPRSSTVRKMQHELVEHYRLTSRSFGEEPNRRLRIYPA